MLQEYRPWLMVVTFGFLGLAFYLSYRPSVSRLLRRRASAEAVPGDAASAEAGGTRRTLLAVNRIMLWIVTAIVLLFVFVPQTVWQSPATGGGLTADMQQTLIQIEGMT